MDAMQPVFERGLVVEMAYNKETKNATTEMDTIPIVAQTIAR
jgi:hypothetical protein